MVKAKCEMHPKFASNLGPGMAEPKCRKCKLIKIEFDKLSDFEKPVENVVSQLVIVPSAVYPAQPV